MKIKTRIGAMLLAGLLIFSFAGCSSQEPVSESSVSNTGENSSSSAQEEPSGDIPTIRFASRYAASDPAGKIMYDYIDEWAQENKDKINLVHETVVGDELRTKIAADIAADNLPDIFDYWGGPAYTPAFVDADLIVSMDEYFEKSEVTKAEDYDQSFFSRTTYKGVKCVLPGEDWLNAWIANKEIFDKFDLEIPTTYDELLEASEVLIANNIYPLAFGSKGGNPSHLVAAEIYNQFENGTTELSELTETANIDSDNMRKTLDLITEWREKGLVPRDLTATGDWGPYTAVYDEGRAAIMNVYTWQLPNLSQETADKSVIIDPIQMPGCVIDVTNFCQSGGTYGTMASKKSWNDPSKQEAMILFLDFLSSEDYATVRFNALGNIPPRIFDLDTSSTTTPLMKEIIATQSEKANRGSNFQRMPGTSAFATFQSALDEFVVGGITSEELISKVDKALKEG